MFATGSLLAAWRAGRGYAIARACTGRRIARVLPSPCARPAPLHTEAIVLSRFDLGEADRVLTLLTPNDGKLKAIAKGVRRPTQPPRRQPGAVRGADLVLARAGPSTSSPRPASATPGSACATASRSSATAWYLAELADRAVEERPAAYPVYALLKRAYQLLDDGMAPGRVARWFEFGLADALGMRPEVERCVECDRVLEPDGASAGCRRWAASSASAPRPRRPSGRRSRSPRSSCCSAYQRLDIEAIAGLRLPTRSRPRSRRRCALHARSRWSASRARSRSSTRSEPTGAAGGARLTRRMSPVVFDSGSDGDAHALARLATDMIGWLTTVTPGGPAPDVPHLVPVAGRRGAHLQRPPREAQPQHREQPAGQPPSQRQRPGRGHRHHRGRRPRGRRDAAPGPQPGLPRQVRRLDRRAPLVAGGDGDDLQRRRSASARRAAGPSGHEPARSRSRWPRVRRPPGRWSPRRGSWTPSSRAPRPGCTRCAGPAYARQRSGSRPPRRRSGSRTSTPTRCSSGGTCSAAATAGTWTSRASSRAASRSRCSRWR